MLTFGLSRRVTWDTKLQGADVRWSRTRPSMTFKPWPQRRWHLTCRYVGTRPGPVEWVPTTPTAQVRPDLSWAQRGRRIGGCG